MKLIITGIGGVWGAYAHGGEVAEPEGSVPRRPARPVLKLLSFIVTVDLLTELHGVSVSLLHSFAVRWLAGLDEFRLIHALFES